MKRSIHSVQITPDFKKSYRGLPVRIKRLADKKDQWFRENAFDRRLKTHKLKGPLKEYWSYSVNRDYRVLFRFLPSNEAVYFDVGTHEIYR